MRAKTSHKLMIFQRVSRAKRQVKLDTQKLRTRLLENLEEIFDLAVSLARGEFKTQTVDGQTVKITLKQRQMWARVASYIAQIINSVAVHFDEREVDVMLAELERILGETKAKAEDETAGEETAEAGTSKSAKG